MTPEELFIHWVTQREESRKNKEILGVPFCDDPIIAKYKFCNVNREHDRVTLWISENIRQEFGSRENRFVILQVLIGRIFNEPETLTHLIPVVDFNYAKKTLAELREKKQKLFRGAYMMPAHNSKGMATDEYYMRIIEEAGALDWDDCFELKDVAERLMSIKGLGEFLANQVCTDLRYTQTFENVGDWTTFVLCGPGTRRGLQRYQHIPIEKSFKQEVYTKALLQIRSLIKPFLPHTINEYFLDPNNLSNCFCEYDKYMRALEQQKQGKRITLKQYAHTQ